MQQQCQRFSLYVNKSKTNILKYMFVTESKRIGHIPWKPYKNDKKVRKSNF